jgi:desumoylating isopeptidase 1
MEPTVCFPAVPMIQGLEASLRAGAVPQPSQFRPAPAAAATTTRQPLSDEVAARATGASKQEADKTVGRGNGSTLPPAAPAPAASAAQPSSDEVVVERSTDNKAGNNGSGSAVPPAVQPAAAQASPTPAAVDSEDPLAEAKRRVQEEIKREFAAIMATGTARAGEAAALATRRVMERHGVQRARG